MNARPPPPPADDDRDIDRDVDRARDIERHDTPVPDSFLALYPASPRGRHASAWRTLVERHAFCEDLAQGLAELARAQRDDLGLARGDVLERVQRGVEALDPPLPPGEGPWVRRRLVELLGWDREGR